MSDMRELAENQGGVIYIEQFEEWVEELIEDFESEKVVFCGCKKLTETETMQINDAIALIKGRC